MNRPEFGSIFPTGMNGKIPMAGFDHARFGITPPGNTQSFVEVQVGELYGSWFDTV